MPLSVWKWCCLPRSLFAAELQLFVYLELMLLLSKPVHSLAARKRCSASLMLFIDASNGI
jgi:hypothetical protein